MAKRGWAPRSNKTTESPMRRATIAISDPPKPEPMMARSKSFLMQFPQLLSAHHGHYEQARGLAASGSSPPTAQPASRSPRHHRISQRPINPQKRGSGSK